MATRTRPRLYAPTVRGDIVPPPPPPDSSMRIGMRAKDQDPSSDTQLAAAFNRVTGLFGPMNLTRNFYGKLTTTPHYVTRPGILEIPSYKTQTTNLAAFVRAMRGPDKRIAYHHEPEADYTTGAQFVAQFKAQYDTAKAAAPDVQFGMIAGGFQYGGNRNGADGSFLPPATKCDWYGFDTYRGGQATGDTGFGAMIPLANVEEFQTWYGYVKNRGKPLYITEYGRGFSYTAGQKTSTGATWTQAQVNNVLARRPGLIQTDYLYLKGLGFAGLNYWYTNYSPGDDWMFTDQPSIDAVAAVVAAETS